MPGTGLGSSIASVAFWSEAGYFGKMKSTFMGPTLAGEPTPVANLLMGAFKETWMCGTGALAGNCLLMGPAK
jgi:hypothetical protein